MDSQPMHPSHSVPPTVPPLRVAATPPTAAGVKVVQNADPEGYADTLTPAEIELLEANTGILFSDVVEAVGRADTEGRGVPFWCASVLLYGMALREHPALTYDQFRNSRLTDLAGRELRGLLGDDTTG